MLVAQIPLATNPAILSEFPVRFHETKGANEDCFPSTAHEPKSLGVAVIGTTELFGEVLISALTAAEPTTRFSLHSSLDDWLVSPSHTLDRILLIYFGSDERMLFEGSIYSGLEKLNVLDHRPRFIVCANHAHYSQVLKALEIGAQGYIVPSMSLKVVLQVIHLVDVGGVFVPASSFKDLPDIGQPSQESSIPDVNGLSPRQILVAKALRKGTPNKIIAYELNMCESTVKVHVRHIMKKLNAKNRTQIAFLTNAMFSESNKD